MIKKVVVMDLVAEKNSWNLGHKKENGTFLLDVFIGAHTLL